MHFSVIYTADWDPECHKVANFAPPHVRKLWDLTETGFNELSDFDPPWPHRKWCAYLTREQFDEFVSHCNLYADVTPTAGSLGAPGFGLGWAPAIAFSAGDNMSYAQAYVTPVPDVEIKHQNDERMARRWEAIRDAVLSIYG